MKKIFYLLFCLLFIFSFSTVALALPGAPPGPEGLSDDGNKGIKVEGGGAFGGSVSVGPVGHKLKFTGAYTVATIPAAPAQYDLILVLDGDSACDTTTGGGSSASLHYYTGAAWTCLGDGGAGSVQLDVLSDVTGEGNAGYFLIDDGDGTYSFVALSSVLGTAYDTEAELSALFGAKLNTADIGAAYDTEAELDALFAAKLNTADIGAAYDTEAELNALFAAKQDASTAATDSELSALQADDLVTLSGVAIGSTHLGEFTGSTIADNQTIKAALQALETAVEGVAGGHDAVTLGTASHDYLSLTDQVITLGEIDIGDDTNLAGTANEIVLTGDTLSLHADITRDSEFETLIEALTCDLDLSSLNSLTLPAFSVAAAPDPYNYYNETDGTDWWTGVDDTGNSFEWRTNVTVGNSVQMELDEDGDLHLTGDLYVAGDDIFATTNTSGALWVGDGTNYNPVVMSGDAAIGTDGAVTVSDLTIASEATGDMLYFDGANWVRIAKAGTDAHVLHYNTSTDTPYWAVDDTGAGGSGSMTTVKEATSQVGGADIVTLDFGAGFDLSEDPDTEINITFDPTEITVWDLGGATSFELVNGTDPDVDAAGELSFDTDGANETGDASLRGYDGSNQFALCRKLENHTFTVAKPNDLADALRDKCPVWSNESGMTFTITKIEAWADTDDTAFAVEEYDADGSANNSTVDAVNCTTGSGPYTATETTITGATIEASHILALDFDDTDDPGWVMVTISGWYNADVD